MPVMDGWEATQEIQKVLNHSVPIIAVTANALKGDREKCLDAGMDDYLTKPVKLSPLLDVTVKWIDLCSHARRDAEEGVTAAVDDTGDGDPSSVVSNLRCWSSFSFHDSAGVLSLIHGEAMPVFDVPFARDDPELAVKAHATTSLEESNSIVNMLAGMVGEPFCDYFSLMHNTGDDHNLVVALLSSFKDSFSSFCDGLALDTQCSLFDAQSLHGAAVSLCAPTAVAAITNFVIATKDVRTNETANMADPNVTLLKADAVANAIVGLQAADYKLAGFIHALENAGQRSGRKIMRRTSTC
jgi:CheY-like chemotaxis protein